MSQIDIEGYEPHEQRLSAAKDYVASKSPKSHALERYANREGGYDALLDAMQDYASEKRRLQVHIPTNAARPPSAHAGLPTAQHPSISHSGSSSPVDLSRRESISSSAAAGSDKQNGQPSRHVRFAGDDTNRSLPAHSIDVPEAPAAGHSPDVPKAGLTPPEPAPAAGTASRHSTAGGAPQGGPSGVSRATDDRRAVLPAAGAGSPATSHAANPQAPPSPAAVRRPLKDRLRMIESAATQVYVSQQMPDIMEKLKGGYVPKSLMDADQKKT